ncbi:MAG: DUF2231 domain-containing protein [Omnitrophica WOR_2 bacterium]
MESRVKIFGHPIHPTLIVFPLGLFATAVIMDIMYLITKGPNFPIVAYWDIIVGIIVGLIAAVFGLIDLLAIPGGSRAKSVGTMHGVGNVILVVLFLISLILRRSAAGHVPTALAMIFSFAGIILGLFTGWLGGELVDRLGVGVYPGANVNSSSSLSGGPAGQAK